MELSLIRTFPFRDLEVSLDLKGKDSLLKFIDVTHKEYSIKIYDIEHYAGLVLGRDESGKSLNLYSGSRIFPNYLLISLVSPNISFRMSLDGNGIGIADIRDFRDGGLRKFKFELAYIQLEIALVFDPSSSFPSIVFAWDKSDYDPFVSNP